MMQGDKTLEQTDAIDIKVTDLKQCHSVKYSRRSDLFKVY